MGVNRVVRPDDRVLLLQGPMGPFFHKFAKWLEDQGTPVWKINLNGGDRFYFRGSNAVDYRGAFEDWPRFVRRFISSRDITRVFLFGDCRLYHRIAAKTCLDLGVSVMVFEEGYIRPDYVTLEEGGVNGFSLLPRDPAFYQRLSPVRERRRVPARPRFSLMAVHSVIYYIVSFLLAWRYPRYAHHKGFNVLYHAYSWIVSGIRKYLYKVRDRRLTSLFATKLSKKYFLVPLQVHNDSQVLYHSDYDDIPSFIKEVIESFAKRAPKSCHLVFKHHPMDRGYRHYRRVIEKTAEKFGVRHRVIYGHEFHLPVSLSHARGVVVINSTVGLSALLHGTPLKVMGRAFYDMAGLTSQKSLHRFWKKPGPLPGELHRKFRSYLIQKTQLNGSFYGLFPFDGVKAGKKPSTVMSEHEVIESMNPPFLRKAPQSVRVLHKKRH